jgi:hypothetical protein
MTIIPDTDARQDRYVDMEWLRLSGDYAFLMSGGFLIQRQL